MVLSITIITVILLIPAMVEMIADLTDTAF